MFVQTVIRCDSCLLRVYVFLVKVVEKYLGHTVYKLFTREWPHGRDLHLFKFATTQAFVLSQMKRYTLVESFFVTYLFMETVFITCLQIR